MRRPKGNEEGKKLFSAEEFNMQCYNANYG